ncbi:hypothetical protein MHB84_16330 [Paenibacillus sp. FSL F4-0087]|uniref:hypothetical protein n=1 Tax=Paenibacillus sp. FSL F4-0087 TaxID=2921368 RepID=UPI00096C4258|nr:hypothetical protein BK122_03320 [Paenibacillus pabuli]
MDFIGRIIKDFSSTLISWCIPEDDFLLIDPFETEYSENYSSATAAVLFAYLYTKTRDLSYYDYFSKLIERSIVLCNDRGVSSFCKVFLIHYSLLAIHYLPEHEKKRSFARFEEFYSSFEDKCGQINTNCAALQWGSELLLSSLSGKSMNSEYCRYLLDHIEKSQNKLGFIDDAVSDHRGVEDGKPIAYHLFIVFILLSIVSTVRKDFDHDQTRAIKIIHKGVLWISNIIATDSSYATLGRSSNQIFTWGCMLLIYKHSTNNGMEFNSLLDLWLRYEKKDGSYSCTPNYFPHSLRVGFEKYTHVNMYNTLSLVGLVISDCVRDEDLLNINVDLTDTTFVDEESGYIFFRQGKSFFGCSLRMHSHKYVPSMQGFHYRVGGKRMPLLEPRLNIDAASDSIFEGYIIKGYNGEIIYPDSIQNASYSVVDNGIDLYVEDSSICVNKSIRIFENEIVWNYKIKANKDLLSCEHIIPILLNDGKHEAKLFKRSDNTVNIYFDGSQYQLTCNRSLNNSISLHRSLCSTSGIGSVNSFRITSNIKRDQVIEWRTSIKLCSAELNGKKLQQKITAKDVIPVINNITLEESTASKSKEVKFTVEAVGNQLTYAWYLYKDSEKIEVKWYSEVNYYQTRLSDAGKYQVRVFIRDVYGNQISRLDNNIVEVVQLNI